MGLLLLLISTLLSSYFHPWRVVDAELLFTIRSVTLSIEPSADVTRDTNVTLRCQAVVSSSGQGPLSRQYTIYKNEILVHTKTSNTSEDLLYPLPKARVSNTGKYKCQIIIKDKKQESEMNKLTVTGQSIPELHLEKTEVSEGDEVTATCMAPGETGSIIFYFYKDSKEILEKRVDSNQTAMAKFLFNSVGNHKIHCAYTVVITPDSSKSKDSNTVTISVKEFPITLVLEVLPENKIYEGDKLDISCTIKYFQHKSQSFHLYLIKGDQILSSEKTKPTVNHSMIAVVKDSRRRREEVVFECKLEIGNLEKVAIKNVSVTELFSEPNIIMSPAEVFQREFLTLTCKSEIFASERLRKEELTYTLDPPESLLSPRGNGVFSGKARQDDFNYTCIAQAKGIMKPSKALTVRPKVSVSIPKIFVVGRAVLKRPFKIHCQSDNGSLPINYTLLKKHNQLSTISVKQPSQKALFEVTVTRTDEISEYTCKAKNSNKDGLYSKTLNDTVIVPLSEPTLTVIPPLPEISEGDHLYLICGIQGTPPVTFKWYRVGNKQPLFTTTANNNHTNYQVSGLAKTHSGTYYCEAVNHANNVVRSKLIDIEVRLAVWKKAVIGGFCLLVVSALVVGLVLYLYRSKRVRVDRAVTSVWSERPPEEANDEETSMVSNEPDVEYTEVVHPRAADSARVPLRKGTDTVYSELQNAPHGAADHHDYGSVEYAELNGEQPEINHCSPEVNNYQDLPVPVD